MNASDEKYLVKWTAQFKKDYKLAIKRGVDRQQIEEVVHLIARGDQQQKLADDYDDHPLKGRWKDHRELHILPNLLLIYRIYEDVLVLSLVRTGQHNDLLGI